MWAIYTVTARRAEVSPLHAAAILSTVSTAAFLPLFFLFGESRLLEIPLGSLAWQAFVHGILGGIVSIWLYSYAIGVLGAGRTGVFAGWCRGSARCSPRCCSARASHGRNWRAWPSSRPAS